MMSVREGCHHYGACHADCMEAPVFAAGATPVSSMSEAVPSGSISRGSAAVLAQQVFTNAGQFVAVTVLAHALGPSGRGAVAFVVSTSLLVGQVLRLGLTPATTYMIARRPEDAPRLFSNSLIVACFSSAIASALTLSVLILAPSLRPAHVGSVALLALCMGILGGDITAVGMAMLWGTKRFGTYAASFITTGWTYAFAMLLAHRIWGLTPASACLIWGLSRLLDATSLIGCSLYRTRLGRPDRTLLRSALRFGIRSAAGELATSTNARADQSIMGAISPERELGLYAVAVNAGEVLLYLPNAVGSAIVPNLVETGYDELEATTLRAFRMVFAVTTVAVVGAAIAGTLLIPLVFGAKFEGSITPFLLLLPGAWGYAAQKVFSSALTGLGQPGRSSLGPLTALLTGLALDAVLIPLYGAQGAAGAASAAFIAGGIASLVAFDLAVPFPTRALLPTVADARTIVGVVSGYRARRRTSGDRRL
jgi:O-antigen/teichoic acid export membrane protein